MPSTPSTQGFAKPSMQFVTMETVTPHSGTQAVRLIKPWKAPEWPNQSCPSKVPLMVPRP